MNKYSSNKNNDNENDLNIHRDFIRKRTKAGERTRFENEIKSIKKRALIIKTIKNGLKKSKQFITKTTAKFVDPNVIISLLTAFYIYKKVHQLENQLVDQKSQVDAIERKLDQPSSHFSMKKHLKDNWVNVAMVGSSVLIPVTKQVYNHWQTKQQLSRTESELNQTKNQLSQAKEETIKVEEASKNKLNQVKQEHEIKINKLYVTLNRLNNFALLSAEKETELLTKIKESKNELVKNFKERDRLKEKADYYLEINNKKETELQESLLDVEVLKTELKNKRVKQAKLIESLKKAENATRLWNFKALKLKSQVSKLNKINAELVNELNAEKNRMYELELEKKTIESKLRSDQKNQVKAKQKIEKLKLQNNKNEVSLQKAIDRTNRYTLKMDELRNKINDYESKNYLEISNKQKLISNLEEKNEKSEEKLKAIKDKLNENIINQEQLNLELAQAKKDLKKASGENKQKICSVIVSKEREIDNYKKNNLKLESALISKGKELAKNYINQENLIQEMKNLENEYKDREKTNFEILQSERRRHEKEYNALVEDSNAVVNEILDFNEKKFSWRSFLSNVPISFNLGINTTKKDEPEPKEEEIFENHIFNNYPMPNNTDDHIWRTSVTERYSRKANGEGLEFKGIERGKKLNKISL